MSNSEGEGEGDIMQWKQFVKLDISVISAGRHCHDTVFTISAHGKTGHLCAGRHCHVTVLTISVDADFLKVESKEKVAVAETPTQGKEAKAAVATLTI